MSSEVKHKFKKGDEVLCNLILNYDDKFNPMDQKGFVTSVTVLRNGANFAFVEWSNNNKAQYNVDLGHLIPFSEDELKKRKLELKTKKKVDKTVSAQTEEQEEITE